MTLLVLSTILVSVVAQPARFFNEDAGIALLQVPNVRLPEMTWTQYIKVPIPCSSEFKLDEMMDIINKSLSSTSSIMRIINSTEQHISKRAKADDETLNSTITRYFKSASRAELRSLVAVLSVTIIQAKGLHVKAKNLANYMSNLKGYVHASQCTAAPIVWSADLLQPMPSSGRRQKRATPLQHQATYMHVHHQPSTFHVSYYNGAAATQSPQEQRDDPVRQPVQSVLKAPGTIEKTDAHMYGSSSRSNRKHDDIPPAVYSPQGKTYINSGLDSGEDDPITSDITQQLADATKNIDSSYQKDSPYDMCGRDNYGVLYKPIHPGMLRICHSTSDSIPRCSMVPARIADIGKYLRGLGERGFPILSRRRKRSTENDTDELTLDIKEGYQMTQSLNETILQEDSEKAALNAPSMLPTFSGGIFGISLNSDLNKVAERLNSLNDVQKKQTVLILNTRQNLISIVRAQDMNNQAIQDKIRYIQNQTVKLARDISTSQRKLQANVDEISAWSMIDTSLQLISSYLLSMVAEMNSMDTVLQEVETRYDQLLSSLHHKRLPESSLYASLVSKELERITQWLAAGYTVPNKHDISPFFQPSSAELSIDGRYIVYKYIIPIVSDEMLHKTYKLITAPVYTSVGWMEINSVYQYFVVDSESSTWSSLSAMDYLECRSNAFSTCVTNYARWSASDDLCFISPLLKGTNSLSKCAMIKRDISLKTAVIIRSIDRCRWIVSPGMDPVLVSKSCSGDSETDASMKTSVVKNVTLIELSAGCKITSDQFSLVCPAVLQVSTVKANLKDTTELISDLSNVKWGKAVELYPGINRDLELGLKPKAITNITSFDYDIDNTLFHNNLAGLDQVLNLNVSKEIQYIDEIAAVRKLSKHILTSQQDIGIDWFPFLPEMRTILAWYAAIMSTICAVLILLYLRRVGHGVSLQAVGAAIPLAKQSWAMEWVETTEKSDAPLTSLIDQVQNITISTKPKCSCNCTEFVADKPMHGIALSDYYGMLFIVLVHLVVAYWMYTCLRKTQLRTQIRAGYIPRNQSMVHHAGEVMLVVSFLIKFKRWFQSQYVSREILVSVCTLPRSYDEWYCILKAPGGHLFRECMNNAWSSKWKFPIVWGNVCIKSRKSPQLDTCHELPSTLVIDRDEIIAQLDPLGFWNWTSVISGDMVMMRLVGLGYNREIYHIGREESLVTVTNL